jgi:hypothetical protein
MCDRTDYLPLLFGQHFVPRWLVLEMFEKLPERVARVKAFKFFRERRPQTSVYMPRFLYSSSFNLFLP